MHLLTFTSLHFITLKTPFVASDTLLQEKHYYLHCLKMFLLFPFNEGGIYMSSSCFTE